MISLRVKALTYFTTIVRKTSCCNYYRTTSITALVARDIFLLLPVESIGSSVIRYRSTAMSFEQPFYRYGLVLEKITKLSVFLLLRNLSSSIPCTGPKTAWRYLLWMQRIKGQANICCAIALATLADHLHPALRQSPQASGKIHSVLQGRNQASMILDSVHPIHTLPALNS